MSQQLPPRCALESASRAAASLLRISRRSTPMQCRCVALPARPAAPRAAAAAQAWLTPLSRLNLSKGALTRHRRPQASSRYSQVRPLPRAPRAGRLQPSHNEPAQPHAHKLTPSTADQQSQHVAQAACSHIKLLTTLLSLRARCSGSRVARAENSTPTCRRWHTYHRAQMPQAGAGQNAGVPSILQELSRSCR